jgi:hypothetical protein
MAMQRLLRISALAVLLTIVFFYPLMAPTPHRIDEEHFKLVRTGMTAADVEAIFGVAPGVYDRVDMLGTSDDPIIAMQNDQRAISVRILHDSKQRHWGSRHGVFFIALDEHDRVSGTNVWSGGRPLTESTWKRWWRKLWHQ